MGSSERELLQELVHGRTIAALGTLDNGEPFVSMVPFATMRDGRALIVHVSRLAGHMRNMQQHNRVSLLIVEQEGPDKLPLALARVTIQGTARVLSASDDDFEEARDAYLRRFPDAGPLFTFPDFSLFLIEVTSARLVGGFAQARTLSADEFSQRVRTTDATDGSSLA